MTSQRGSSLVFSLVILTAITLGAVVGMQRSSLQLRMVGNMQHQQALFNASYSDLNAMFEGFRDFATANQVLFSAISNEGSNPGTSINPYTGSALVKPSVHNTIKSPTTLLRVLALPDSTPNSLKMVEGSSAGTLAPYYFAAASTAVDATDRSYSSQEIGFFYLAPAP